MHAYIHAYIHTYLYIAIPPGHKLCSANQTAATIITKQSIDGSRQKRLAFGVVPADDDANGDIALFFPDCKN